MKSLRAIGASIAVALTLSACASGPSVPEPQALVGDALKTIEILKAREDLPEFRAMLKRAHGVMIFPALYKIGFIIGAEGGNGVVLSRDASGKWGYPAFYAIAAGSVGLQAGGQMAHAAFIIRSEGAVKAIIDHQGKFGADAGVSIGPYGSGLEGSVTTNLSLDVVAFSDVRGLFGGASLEGAAVVRRNDYNAAYYGKGATPQSILIDHAHRNQGADRLRAALKVP
ncbi:MAG: lipid-binding SYLF domain-containing protein [Rhodospirillales bacterium]|nr:lipid-binding SYLF domain-containing protein [Rhodospirillales bacterium]